MEKFNFSTPIQIRMSDLDPFVHVNNGAQCNLFDYGRSAYLENLLGNAIQWNELDLVLVHLELDFCSPVLISDQIVCDTKIYELGNKSMKMLQHLRDTKTNTVKTICKSVIAGLDRHSGSSVPIREIYKEKVRAFENGVTG